MEPYTGRNNVRQYIVKGYFVAIMGFIIGIISLNIDLFVSSIIIASSVGLCFLMMGLAVVRTYILQKQEERQQKHNRRYVVQYYDPAPPIVIVQSDNTYYVGTLMEEHHRHIYRATQPNVYVAAITSV